MNIGFKEDMHREFKSDINGISDDTIIEAVVSFANTDGGVLYIGVEDDGEVTGLNKTHEDTVGLAAMVANKTVPAVSVRAIIELVGATPIVAVEVPKRTAITATSSGKILKRRLKADNTPENVPMYPYEINSRLSDLSLLDFSALPVPDATYDDIDPLERQRLRRVIEDYHGEATLLELSDEELDKALRLVIQQGKELIPTYTGLLLLGKPSRLRDLMPTAESSIQIMEGTNIRVNESFTLPLIQAFETINDVFSANNKETELEMGLYRMSIFDFDKRAFRESLVNAYCHRDYSVLGRVRVLIDNQGLTISNPGGFIEGITIDNLLDAEPHGRNPVLADAMKRIGLAERSGRGIDRIFEGSLLYGKQLPDYSSSNSTRVTLFIPKSLPDISFVKMISEENQRTGRSMPIYSLLVLNYLKNNKKAQLKDIAQAVHNDETKVKVAIENLVEAGLIEARGDGRGRHYILSSRVYQAQDNMAGYVRVSGIDQVKYEGYIIELAEKEGFVTRGSVAELLNISLPQAYRRLVKLVEEGKLRREGEKRNTKYFING